MKRLLAPLLFLLVLAPLVAFADDHVAAKAVDGVNAPFFVDWLDGLRAENGEPNEWATWIGRFHLLVLHLPIGFLFATFLLELYAIIRRKHDFRIQTRFLLGMTVIVTWIAIATGLLFALEVSDGIYKSLKMELLSWHGTGALIFGVLVTLAYFFKRGIVKRGMAAEPRPVGKRRFIYMLLFLASVGMVKLVGHHGGSLVHGSDFLSEAAPAAIPSFITNHLGPNSILMPQPHKEGEGGTDAPPKEGNGGESDDGDAGNGGDPDGGDADNGADVEGGGNAAVVFDDKTFYGTIVQPIFDRSCTKCHGADPDGKKPKAGYDMTNFDALVDYVNPGDAEDSDLFILIDLPVDDDDHMPPEGKAPQLSDLEKEQIRWWIDNGAKERSPLNDAPEKLRKKS